MAVYPDEFRDGARCAILQKYEGPRESYGYPLGFHYWPAAARDAWLAGFSCGFSLLLQKWREEFSMDDLTSREAVRWRADRDRAEGGGTITRMS